MHSLWVRIIGQMFVLNVSQRLCSLYIRRKVVSWWIQQVWKEEFWILSHRQHHQQNGNFGEQGHLWVDLGCNKRSPHLIWAIYSR